MSRLAVLALVLLGGAAFACRKDRAPQAAASPSRADAMGVPGAADLDAYVSGAGSVHLGMTEEEVSDALDTRPTKRHGDEVAWEGIRGQRPGSALGQFADGRLRRIEFAPSPWPELPRVSRDTVRPLLTGDVARRSYERTLRMADIEAVVGPGYRMSLFIDGRGGPTQVGSRWIWEVESGTVLYVDEVAGQAGQPVTRELK